ncbi:diguanylate cyclase domain-containing protein [Pseudomonas sp. C2B4]|uniref:diguanylate cyclase domain-containing protein n=1 Tax=Pseudomonas sp. C2B4 TaxID=2735270 RepID=UPI001586B899|nr:diguanylate cyclase [Pseudomonas sp. C2B4]NUU38424.1 diguanylate cyclase [Pseudomonas sp. C2B4]
MIRKTNARVYVVITLSIVLVSALILGGLLTVRRLDSYIRIMYYGNSAPIGHLANIRAAQADVRRLQWRIFATRDTAKAAEYAREINANLSGIAREWQLYYPEGVSSAAEKQIAEQLRLDLPQASMIIWESLRRLKTDGYDKTMDWYQQQMPFLDRLDHLLAEDIDTNISQAAKFAAMSNVIFDRILWIAVALLVLGLIGGIGGVVVSLRWRRQRDDAELKSREHRWLVDQVFNSTKDGVIITDRSGRITKVNPAFTKMTGYTEVDVLGKNPSLWSSGRQTTEFYAEMWRCLLDLGHWEGQMWNRKKSGDIYLESLSITAIPGLDQSELNFAAVCSDITQQHAEQEFQGYLATHDPLTALPNRLLFVERMTQAIARGNRAGSRVAILFLDLDHFKEINDSLGHGIGDGTLMTVATRLKGCLREVDTVARLGGDEFAIVLEDIHEVEQIEPIARKLLASVGEPIVVDGHRVFVTPSIGVSVYPDHGDTPKTLVKLADEAMYVAKNAGKNAIRFYKEPEPEPVEQC